MIKRLKVSHYRSLGQSIDLRLSPVSILVGPNGSGKSNLLDVLSFVRDAVSLGLPGAITHRGGIDNVRKHSTGRPFDVSITMEIELKEGAAGYGFSITGDRLEEYRVKSEHAFVNNVSYDRHGADWKGPTEFAPRIDDQSLALTALGGALQFKPLSDFLSEMAVYTVFPDTLREPQKYDHARPMKAHGQNWVSILRELLKSDETRTDLVRALKRLSGDIEDIRVKPAANHLITEFKQTPPTQKSKTWFGAAQQSDGTLRVAGLITALLQKPPLPVIGIEEPELTVHPGVLPMLMDYLKQAGTQSQILVSTHSPILLDEVNIENDSIFVVNRRNGTTVIRRVRDKQLEPVKSRLMSLGDLFASGDLQLSLDFDSQQENEE